MSLKIKFVSDYVCPYCLVAKVPFLEAVKGRDVEIEWIPFELTPEPEPQVDTYHDAQRHDKWAKTLMPLIEALHLPMKVPPKVIPRPYTRLAFEGWHFAVEQGFGDAYNSRMYEAYFMDELDIGNIDVLTELAAEVGLDPKLFRKALEDGVYTEKQKQCIEYAQNELEIHVVPTIFIGNKKVEGGVYTKEGFDELLDEAMKNLNLES